jgi:hypothetical protein
MSVYYPLSAIEDCLPTEYEEEWTDDILSEKQRILNLEFYKLLRAAIDRGQVRIYSSSGRLLSPNALGKSYGQCLAPSEINSWLKENNLPYSWKPEKLRTTTLDELKERGELKTDCLAVALNLKARGFPPESIDKQKVATELAQKRKYKRFKEDTIYHRIRSGWWRVA